MNNEDNKQVPSGAQTEPDYTKPVAYDQQGRPLYAHPPTQAAPAQPFTQPTADNQPDSSAQAQQVVSQQSQPQHHYVHVTRPMAPNEVEVPAYIQERHEKSRKLYPHLNLSEGEYIINAVKRHPIGLLEIWGGAFILIIALAAVLVSILTGGGIGGNSEIATLGALVVGFMAILIMAGALVAAYVYNQNRFYLTNESVIQEIQTSLFSKHEQTVSLANIEDASFRQNGILPHLLDYGTIRLSTEGDETTYRFSYVAQPKRHIAVLNNAVEAFKNGRPVDPPGADQLS